MAMLYTLPLGACEPRGLLRQFLETQMQGLTGHIEKAGYPFDSSKWGEEFLSNNGQPQWWAYEQTAYWLDGFARAAILLRDEKGIEKAKSIIYPVIDNAAADGYLGPLFMKKTDGWNRWPHVVFFRAVMALYEYTGDKRLLFAVEEHYLGAPVSHAAARDVLNVEIMLWAYEKGGNKALLALAEKTYLDYQIACEAYDVDLCDKIALSDKKPYAHGVSYNEYSKLGAILYRYTGKEIYLNASVNAYKKLDEYFMLPSGCHCSDEYLWDDDYMRSVETCDVTDYTWSLGYLLSATGDTSYADKIERCVFNAGVGAVTEDFKALQYFSCANQVIADSTSNHNDFFKGSKWMSYRPNPGTECCPGNVNRFMPNYVARQYYTDEKGDIYSMLFGEGCLTCNGITIEQTTDFPFKEAVKYQIKCNAEFTFYVKIPSYAKSYTAFGSCASVKKNGFLVFHVTGDTEIEVSFDSGIERHERDGNIYFTKGVLTYAFSVPTDRQIDAEEERSDAEFPAYNMRPNGDWQYGLLPEAPVFAAGTRGAWAIGDGVPTLTVQAKKIANWELERQTKVKWIFGLAKPMIVKEKEGDFTFTPRIPEAPRAVGEPLTLTLYPYGLTKLRLTVFPTVRSEK